VTSPVAVVGFTSIPKFNGLIVHGEEKVMVPLVVPYGFGGTRVDEHPRGGEMLSIVPPESDH
jgi:hypothetical protein